jgi:polysaccharide export outer membrane protein
MKMNTQMQQRKGFSRLGRFACLSFICLGLVACDQPRTAPVQREILGAENGDVRDFMVMAVERNHLETIATWPLPAAVTRQPWLPRNRGPLNSIIRPGDRLTITVWDNNPNSLMTTDEQRMTAIPDTVVAPEGTVFVPYLDPIVVTGMTPDQARREIQSQMALIVPSAQVQINVAAGRRNTVDLVGGVNRAGSFAIPDRDFTVLSLISQGGGVSAQLENPQIRLIRDNQTYGIALERLINDAALDTTMRGGDRVMVQDDSRRFVALGASGRQDLIPFGREHVSALDAVSMIGGVSGTRGNPAGILILREYAAQAIRPYELAGPTHTRVVFTLDLTNADGLFSAGQFAIQPQDLVMVTESPITSTSNILRLLGQVVGLGRQLN